VRAFGTGFAIGIGRGGSVLAPIIAGFLFTGGLALQWVAFVMALGSLAAAGVLMMLKLKPETPEGASAETREDLGGEFSGAVATQGR
jgi:hypothetical protein